MTELTIPKFKYPASNTSNRTITKKLGEQFVSVLDFGALPYPADSSAAVQAGYNYLISVGGGTLFIPRVAGGWLWNTALNATDSFVPVDLVGEGSANLPNARPNDDVLGTTIFLNTGNVGVDLSGHGTFGIKNITFDTNHATKVTNPARIGILGARSVASSSNQNHRFENMSVFMRTTNSAVSPSIGIFCDNVELMAGYNCWFFADVPAVFTNVVLYGVTSPFTTITDAVQSATDNCLVKCGFVSCSGLGPSIRFEQTVNNTFVGSYFGNDVIGAQTYPSILCTGPVQKLNLLGFQAEGRDNFIEVQGNLIDCTFYGSHASTDITQSIGVLNGGNIDGNKFHIYNSATSSSYTAYSGVITGALRNNEFELGYGGNVSLTVPLSVSTGNRFTKIGAEPTITWTTAVDATYYVNGAYYPSPSVRTPAPLALTKNAKTNNVAFALATVFVPNSELVGQIQIPYTCNSSDGQRFVGGELRVNISRKGGSNAAISISESLAQVSQLVIGAETLGVTFALSGLTGAAGADQSFTINVTINSSTGGTGYFRGIATLLTSYFTNIATNTQIFMTN